MHETARASHDAVLVRSSREQVASYNAAERERKAAHAAEIRRKLHGLRYARMGDELVEAQRKRAMHDAVRHAAIEGFHYPVDSLGQPLSPEVRDLSPATALPLSPASPRSSHHEYAPRAHHSPRTHTPPPPHRSSAASDSRGAMVVRPSSPRSSSPRPAAFHAPYPRGGYGGGYYQYGSKVGGSFGGGGYAVAGAPYADSGTGGGGGDGRYASEALAASGGYLEEYRSSVWC